MKQIRIILPPPEEDATVKRVICKTGQTQPGLATVTLEKDGRVAVFKDVPAEICDDCGEYYLSAAVAARLQQLAREARERGSEVEIARFIAA